MGRDERRSHPREGTEPDERRTDAETTPEPVRPETVQESQGVSPHQQADPPKAEGDRDEAER